MIQECMNILLECVVNKAVKYVYDRFVSEYPEFDGDLEEFIDMITE